MKVATVHHLHLSISQLKIIFNTFEKRIILRKSNAYHSIWFYSNIVKVIHVRPKTMLIKLTKTFHCFHLVYVWFLVSHYALNFYSRHCKVIFYQLSKKGYTYCNFGKCIYCCLSNSLGVGDAANLQYCSSFVYHDKLSIYSCESLKGCQF